MAANIDKQQQILNFIQKQIDENTFEEKKVGQRFIINIP